MNFADLPELRIPRSFTLKVAVFGLIAMAVAIMLAAYKHMSSAEREKQLQTMAAKSSAPLMPLTVTPVADQLIIEETVITIPDTRASTKATTARKQSSYLTQRVVIHQSVDRPLNNGGNNSGGVASIKARPVTVIM